MNVGTGVKIDLPELKSTHLRSYPVSTHEYVYMHKYRICVCTPAAAGAPHGDVKMTQ